jgi:hypothetical protein
MLLAAILTNLHTRLSHLPVPPIVLRKVNDGVPASRFTHMAKRINWGKRASDEERGPWCGDHKPVKGFLERGTVAS